MIKSTFTSVLNNVWPTLVILEVVIILMRIFYIKNSGKKFILHEELLLFYMIYFQKVLHHSEEYDKVQYLNYSKYLEL